MSTDREWERWGQMDPYYGVITHDKFRRRNLDDASRREFFDSGRVHVDYVLAMCRTFIDASYSPVDVLDFGCGVGRVVIPFASHCQRAVGLDVSTSMLEEARRNCEFFDITNVELACSTEDLSLWHGSFDLVHTCIVLQHIEPGRVRTLFEELLRCIRPGGIGAVQLTYAKAWHPATWGRPPEAVAQLPAAPPPRRRMPTLKSMLGGLAGPAEAKEARRPSDGDPGMQMYSHDLNPLLFMMQRAGIGRFHVDFTDHGGELGVSLFFRTPTRG